MIHNIIGIRRTEGQLGCAPGGLATFSALHAAYSPTTDSTPLDLRWLVAPPATTTTIAVHVSHEMEPDGWISTCNSSTAV